MAVVIAHGADGSEPDVRHQKICRKKFLYDVRKKSRIICLLRFLLDPYRAVQVCNSPAMRITIAVTEKLYEIWCYIFFMSAAESK
jgi:hypothetical protein